MFRAMHRHEALFGGGPGGRFWHAHEGFAAADALVTLTLLLGILSRSDRAASEVLDAEAPLP
jgi:hypothetical protein